VEDKLLELPFGAGRVPGTQRSVFKPRYSGFGRLEYAKLIEDSGCGWRGLRK
jgi:hypothetical protein